MNICLIVTILITLGGTVMANEEGFSKMTGLTSDANSGWQWLELPGFEYHFPDENGAPCDDRHPEGWCSIEENPTKYVYKILRQDEWEYLQKYRYFGGSVHDIQDGFIHLANGHQLNHVISKFFYAEKYIYILTFEGKEFGLNLKYENGYPHLYNTVLTEDLLEEVPLKYRVSGN
jgi:uncharacterized protein (DUF952 family)